MALVANYRAVKRGDEDALLLAQRWSKYMAVTFAVGAVTGTVLTFEFGLLWPTFMGRFGAAFGIPFAVEGLFFFLEAIFIAIYIYGWKRLKPWPHFWTGVPIVIAGIGGVASVVAANVWMNEPAGFTLNSAGKVTSVDPIGVIFNSAMPYETAHMLVAAYLVGGFLIASVYAAGMLRGRRDRYHRLGFIIPFTVAAIAAPVQMLVGDTLARYVYNNEPTKFAAIELVPKTKSDVPETLLGHLNSNGSVTGGLAIPGLASILSDPSTRTSTVVQGLNAVPKQDEPTVAEVNIVHLGVGRDGRARHPAVPALGLVRARLVPTARPPEEPLVPPGRRGQPGVAVHRGPGGRLGRHRGRPPALDRAQLPHGPAGLHHEPRGVGHLPRGPRRVPRGRRHDDPDPAVDEPPVAGRPGARRRRSALRSPRADPTPS